MSVHRFLIVLLVLAYLAVPAARGQDLILRFAPEPATQYRFGVEQAQDIAMSLGPMGEQNMTNTSRFEMRWQVLDRAENGDTRVRMNLDRLVMRVEQGETTIIALDTDAMDAAEGEEAVKLADAMRLAMASELTTIVSPRGEIVGITGFEAMWARLHQKVGGDAQVEQIVGMIEQGFSEDSLAQQLRQTFPVFPQQAVREGDTWVDESETTNPIVGSIAMTSTYTVGEDKSENGQPCRELLIETTIEMTGASDMVEKMQQMSGAEMDVAFDEIETKGTMCIDYATGLPVTSNMGIGMTMRMSMELPENDQAADSEKPSKLDMKIVLDGTVTMHQLSAKPAASKATEAQ